MDISTDILLGAVKAATEVYEADPKGFEIKAFHRQRNGSSTPQWGIFKEGTVMYLVFRGTDSIPDVVADVSAASLTTWQTYRVSSIVNRFFTEDFEEIMRTVRRIFQESGQHRQWVVCGHSLGGVYATASFMEMAKDSEFQNLLSYLVTFGCPPCLHPDTCEDYCTEAEKAINFVLSPDPVPNIFQHTRSELSDFVEEYLKRLVGGLAEYAKQKHDAKQKLNEALRTLSSSKAKNMVRLGYNRVIDVAEKTNSLLSMNFHHAFFYDAPEITFNDVPSIDLGDCRRCLKFHGDHFHGMQTYDYAIQDVMGIDKTKVKFKVPTQKSTAAGLGAGLAAAACLATGPVGLFFGAGAAAAGALKPNSSTWIYADYDEKPDR